MKNKKSYLTFTESSSLLRWPIFILLLVQASIPIGFMPSSIAEGQFLKLCPGNVPSELMAVLHSTHHHAHHGEQSETTSFECPFDSLLSEQIHVAEESISLRTESLQPTPRASYIATLSHLSRYQPRAPPYLRNI